ncbi:MAG TPA: fluoride efflux transporter CrcB [Acidimicrobiales bacterium]|jgi:CrcB protein|nr:fluoride efflux transporter CrcB [Acidimicrobiales bacterium]
MSDEPVVLPIDPDSDELRVGAARPRGTVARPDVLAVIALGGALGAAARYGLARAIPTATNAFPWATFWTNLSGSFVLGLFLVVVLERLGPTRYLRPFVATGFIGAFTTFSTFAVETDLLVKDGHPGTAAAYVVATLFAGLACAWLGIGSGRVLAGGRHIRREPR